MSVDSLLEFGAELATDAITDVASDVITEAASDLFGDVFLSGLDSADAFLGEQLSGSLLDQAGSFAGSGSFWDTFSPGDIWDNVVGSVTDFFNPNEGLALTQQFAGQTPGTSIGSLLGDAYTTVTDFLSPNAGVGLTQQILGTNPISALDAGLGNYASLGNFIGSTVGSANPINSVLSGLVSNQTFDLGTVLKVATAVGPQAVNALFGGGTTGQLAAQVFRTGAGLVSGAVNPQVMGPNAGPQLPVRQGTTVFDNSYGGGSQAEFNAINDSIRIQQEDNAAAGLDQAASNVASALRTYDDSTRALDQAQEALTQANSSVDAYDRLLAEPGLTEQQIADLTAQRQEAAAAATTAEQQRNQLAYENDVARNDYRDATATERSALQQYQDVLSANQGPQNISPNLDPNNPAVNTNPIPATAIPGAVSTGDPLADALARAEAIAQGPGINSANPVNSVIAALGGPQATQVLNQILNAPGSVIPGVAGLPTVNAATIGNIIRTATGVDPNSDAGAALLQQVASALVAGGANPDLINQFLRTSQATIDQGLVDQARNVATLRQQTQNPAQSGDWRVRLRLAPQSNYLYNAPSPGILQPLKLTDGVIFPYTPRINTVYRADYEAYNLIHSNYRGLFYKSSYAGDVSIDGTFTAQDTTEANYLLAVIHFFRSATKMFYGQDALRGAPPPLVFLSGLGEYQYNEHPCVITSFQYNLPDGVDYIRAYSAFPNGTNLLVQRDRFQGTASNPLSYALQRLASVGLTKGALDNRIPPPTLGVNNPNYVPTKMDINLTLIPVQSRSQVSKQFSLQNFANGNLLKGGFW